MKPYLLMLLLAIPPLVCNLLACENAETTDTPATAAKSDTSAASISHPTASPAAPAAKPAPPPHCTPDHAKVQFK